MPMNQKDLLTWCDDLHQVKGNVSQLQATLNQILSKAPTIQQYKLLAKDLEDTQLGTASTSSSTIATPSTVPSIPSTSTALTSTQDRQLIDRSKAFLLSPHIKVAIRLKDLFEKGLLPLLLSLTKINFKSTKSDRFVGYFLDYNPPKTVINRIPDVLKKTIPKENKNLSLVLNNYPPTLPPISEQSLLKLIFTDKSYRQPIDFIELEAKDGPHYYNKSHNRRLSLKGNHILQLIIFEILDEKFLNIDEDDILFLQRKLTSTNILSKLAFTYNLVDPLYHNLTRDNSSIEIKIESFKNVFLAYIGGLSMNDYSLKEIKIWIEKLYEPIIARFYKIMENSNNLKDIYELAYAELNFLIKRNNSVYNSTLNKKIDIEFETVSDDPVYITKVKVGNIVEGLGTSSKSIEESKMKGYYDIVNSKSKMNQLMSVIFENFKTPPESNSQTVTYNHSNSHVHPPPPPPPPPPTNHNPISIANLYGGSNTNEAKKNTPSIPPPPPPPLPSIPSNEVIYVSEENDDYEPKFDSVSQPKIKSPPTQNNQNSQLQHLQLQNSQLQNPSAYNTQPQHSTAYNTQSYGNTNNYSKPYSGTLSYNNNNNNNNNHSINNSNIHRGPLPYGSLPPNPNHNKMMNNNKNANAANNNVNNNIMTNHTNNMTNNNMTNNKQFNNNVNGMSYTLPTLNNDISSRIPVDSNAKNNLNQLLSSKNLNANYRNHKVGNDYQITILIGDVILGVAYDTNKKIASQKAAMNALNNHQGLHQLGFQ